MKKTSFLFVFLLILTISPLCAQAVSLYDLGDHFWAQESVYRLAEKGIINGTAPHYYSPESYVSKGELCALLCRIFELDSSRMSSFPDVSEDSYYYGNIAALKALGILEYESDGNFHPDNPITRESTMRIAGFLLDRLGFAEIPETSCIDNFADAHTLSGVNKEYAALLVSKGYILGDTSGNLNPGGYLTRAEIAVILDRLYTDLK